MIRLGKRFVTQFFVLLKTSQNYNEGHAATNIPLENVLNIVREIHRRNKCVKSRLFS